MIALLFIVIAAFLIYLGGGFYLKKEIEKMNKPILEQRYFKVHNPELPPLETGGRIVPGEDAAALPAHVLVQVPDASNKAYSDAQKP
jgi:hypothetical protein